MGVAAHAEERVVLVDETDREVGTEGKMAAHLAGKLHRALSVFVFNRDGALLLQRRATAKYHSAGLWSNTCCSHPRPGEVPAAAAHRRLVEELGFDCPLQPAGTCLYRRALPGGLIEHELDHIFVGRFDGVPSPDPDEVAEWKWVQVDDVAADLRVHPERYSAWFGLALERVLVGRGGLRLVEDARD
jgi:isopentenyl-diphosphate delta-isomerase